MLKSKSRNGARLLGFGFVLGAAHASAAPIPLPWGISLTPSLDNRVRYDDNVGNTGGDSEESWANVVSPTFLFEVDNGIDFYSASYTAESGSYFSSARDDYTDHQLQLSASVELTSGTSISIDGRWDAGHDERGTGFSQGDGNRFGEPDKYFHRRMTVGFEYRPEGNPFVFDMSLGAEARIYERRLAIAGRDRSGQLGSVSAGYRMGSRTTLVTQIDYNDIDFATPLGAAPVSGLNIDNQQTDYLVGVDWTGAKTDLSLRLGERHKDYGDDGRANFIGPTWRFNLSWSPLSYSTLSVSSQRRTNEPRGFADFIDVKNHNVGWDHDWSGRLSTGVSFTTSESDYYGTQQLDEGESSALTLNYLARPWLTFRTGLNHLEQRSTVERMNFQRNISFVGVTVSL